MTFSAPGTVRHAEAKDSGEVDDEREEVVVGGVVELRGEALTSAGF